MAKQQKQMQKRATNVHVSPNSGGIVLRGVDVNFDTTTPEFSIVIAAGGNSATATLTSGNASLFEYIRVEMSDSKGRSASGLYAGAPIVLNTTNVSKASSSVYPNITFMVVFKLKDALSLADGSPVLNYQIPLDAATVAAGITIRTDDRLNTIDRGTVIEITAVYDASGTPDITTIDITSIASIGMVYNIQKDGVSVGNITVGTDGTGQLVANGTLASGSYVFKAICTTAGAAFGSFAETTVVVP